jgi:hypothetical protein
MALGSGQVGFVVDKVALGQVSSEYFDFPCESSFHQVLHPNNHPGQVLEVADVPSQFGFHPPLCELKIKISVIKSLNIEPFTLNVLVFLRV